MSAAPGRPAPGAAPPRALAGLPFARPAGPRPAGPAPLPAGSGLAAWGQDSRAPWQAGGGSQPVQALAANGGLLGWVGGALAGAFWAVPKLARFGPIGFLGSALVVLGCGYYGKRVVAAGQALLQGSVRGAAELASWFAGARLAAGLVAGLSKPGALTVAFVVWLGSWAAGKAFDALWPAGRS